MAHVSGGARAAVPSRGGGCGRLPPARQPNFGDARDVPGPAGAEGWNDRAIIATWLWEG